MLETDGLLTNDDDGKTGPKVGVDDVETPGDRGGPKSDHTKDPDVADCRRHGIAVEARGRALRVHGGDLPHLVSLGSDRFSTAVTLHPIPRGTLI